MIKKYGEEKRKEVIKARKAGLTIAQIAIQTGVGRTTIKAWLKNAGLTANRKWKADEIQAILKEYEECRSPKAIMEKYAISKSELYRLLMHSEIVYGSMAYINFFPIQLRHMTMPLQKYSFRC